MNQSTVLQLDLLSPPQHQSSLEFSSKRISKSILNLLKYEISIHPVTEGFTLNVPQLEDKEYQELKGVIGSLKGKWTGKTHFFDYDPSRLLKEVLSVGKVPKSNPYHFFETPDPEIEDLFIRMDLPEGEEWELSLLEPSCGRGAIARKLRQRLPNSSLDVVEIDTLNQEKLRLDGFNLIGSNFLEIRFAKTYDYILSNPPFDGTAYIDHLKKQFRLLKPGGKLGAIAPVGMLTGTSKQIVEFRNYIAERGHWEYIGAPFTDTPTKCVALTMENLSCRELESRWSQSNGYESTYQEELELALSCDRQWHDKKQLAETYSEDECLQILSDALDTVIHRFIQKEYLCFVYNTRVKDQLLRSAFRELAAA
jgi:SAM-dependent methyltransferase